MPTGTNYKLRGVKELLASIAARTLLLLERKLPRLFGADEEIDADLYASSMTTEFNLLHSLIFPRFFRRINVEVENIDHIRDLSQSSTIVYVTKDVGQLEYNFFNYLFLKEDLPLAKFVNELSLWQWLPFSDLHAIVSERAKRFKDLGPLPHPVSSGYSGAIIESGGSVFVRLKSTAIYNDLYWYTASTDPLAALLAVEERSLKPIYIVPLDFMWDKRPEKTGGSIIDIFPKRLGKIITFWKNYKSRAVVKISAPIKLSEYIENYRTDPILIRARKLRAELLYLLHQEKKVTTGPALKPRSVIIDELLEDESLQKAVYEISAEKKKTVEDLQGLARKYAEEIAADINYNYIELGHRLMNWVLKNIYDGIVIGQEGLSNLKKAAAKAPIILVPNHKSHMDYLLLSTVLYEDNVSIPHIAAGLNLAFWPMGHIFRKCGAFFLRRSFAGNKLYRSAFKAYLKILLKEGYCQEFFIEGGRSRTGKLLRPRTGMLTMLAESVAEGATPSAYFVPVAITYDKVIEEYKGEVVGEAKKKEGTRDLFRLGKYLKRRYGRIYVNFGEPILYQNTTGGIPEKVLKLANAITITINRETVVTPSAVAAVSALISPKKGITRESIFLNAKESLKHLEWKGAQFSDSLKANSANSLTEAIGQFEAMKALTLHDEFDPACFEIKEDSRITLDYYKNNIIHFFVSAGVMASILLSYIKKGNLKPTIEELKRPYIFCKRLFAHEFAFGTRMNVEEHIEKVVAFLDETGFGIERLELYKSIVANFFESYLAALTACRNMEPMEEKALLKKMRKCARHMLLLGMIERPEAISTPIFKDAISNFLFQGILKAETDAKGRKLYSWLDKDSSAENLKQKLEELA